MKKIIFILTIYLFFSGCITLWKSSKKRVYHRPPPKVYSGYHEVGIASWYGDDFHGKPTASGEIYNMYAMTAAHKTLPLGTYVNVKNLENGKEVVVKVNDRGPFVAGRIIDLSYAAAKKLGMANKGIAKVRITVVKSPFLTKKGNKFNYKRYYAVQVASFQIYANAKKMKQILKKHFVKTYIKKFNINGQIFYRVFIGNYKKKNQAEWVLNKAENLGYDGFVVEIDK